MEDVISIVVASAFIIVGLFTVIWPSRIREIRSTLNKRYAISYQKNELFDGKESLVQFLYRVGGTFLLVIGIFMFAAFF